MTNLDSRQPRRAVVGEILTRAGRHAGQLRDQPPQLAGIASVPADMLAQRLRHDSSKLGRDQHTARHDHGSSFGAT